MLMKIHQGFNDMNRQLLFLLIGIIFFLGGCSMAPKYTRPESPIPTDWPKGSAYQNNKSSQTTTAVADLRWQEFFADPKLQQVIETALHNNRDLRLAALNVEKARAM